MPESNQNILKIQPVVKNWLLFGKGAYAAGFNYSLLAEQPTSNLQLSMANIYRFSGTMDIPNFFLDFIGNTEPFYLQGDTYSFIFETRNPIKPELRIFSRKYTSRRLKVMTEKILGQLVQQYAYLKIIESFNPKDYMLSGETVKTDLTVIVSLRRWSLMANPVEDMTVLSGPQREEIIIEITPSGMVLFDLNLLEEFKQKEYIPWLGRQLGRILEMPDYGTPHPKIQTAPREKVGL